MRSRLARQGFPSPQAPHPSPARFIREDGRLRERRSLSPADRPRRIEKKGCGVFLRNITRRTLHWKDIPVLFSSSSGSFLKASGAKGKDAAPVTKNLHRNLTENVRFCEEIQKNFPKAGGRTCPPSASCPSQYKGRHRSDGGLFVVSVGKYVSSPGLRC